MRKEVQKKCGMMNKVFVQPGEYQITKTAI